MVKRSHVTSTSQYGMRQWVKI